MSERDRDRAQGSSPYDEPTGTIRIPAAEARDAGAPADQGPSTDPDGVYGYQPYRRGARGPRDERDPGAIADGEPGHLTASAGRAKRPPYWDDDTDAETTAIVAPRAGRAAPVDRDAFHREHNRYAVSDRAEQAGRDAAGIDDDAVTEVFDEDFAAAASSTTAPDGIDESATRPVTMDKRGRRGARSATDEAAVTRADAAAVQDRTRGQLEEDLAAATLAARRGTTDLGLLLLRVAVGMIAMAHGAQKLFGWWNGPRLSGFEDFLTNPANTDIGFRSDAAKPLAIVGALSESLGGLMLVLGLLTPVVGSAVLGVMIIAATYKATLAGGVWFFASDPDFQHAGVEYELFIAAAAAAIIVAGPGRWSLDFGRGWARRPGVGSVACLVVGIAVPVAIWIVFNGTNPFTSPGNPPLR